MPNIEQPEPLRDQNVKLLLTPDEKRQLQSWAKARGLPVNNALRNLLYEQGVIQPQSEAQPSPTQSRI